MPPASILTCTFPGCQSGPTPEGEDTPGSYITHIECQTRADVKEDLKDHVHMVHDLPLKHQQVQVSQYQAETDRLRLTPQNSVDDELLPEDNGRPPKLRAKLETIPRPKIQSSSTESDWSFF